ncbi:muramidase [Pseudomonas juntendi]|uniref:muramidase n=1 Tax=Pseudomonas juntendi TaxID=2666183 RepID=UPI003B926923
MPFLDLPPNMEERVVCSITAAIKYEIPANLMLAVAEKENGPVGKSVRHANGSVDVGAMQFNVNYLKELNKKYGITAEDAAQSGCYPYDLAAWRIRGHLRNDAGDIWTRASNYHSRTPSFNSLYRADLVKKAEKWGGWLSERFTTYDPNSPTTGTFVTTTADGTPKESDIFIQRSTMTAMADATPSAVRITAEPRKRTFNEAAERALEDMYAPRLKQSKVGQ